MCSTRIEVELRVLVRDLNNDVWVAKLEDEPNDPLRLTIRVLAVEPKRVNEVVRDLKSAVCSAKLEVELRDPDRDLNNELCSARLENELRAPLKIFERPLVSEAPIVNEPLGDLKSDT